MIECIILYNYSLLLVYLVSLGQVEYEEQALPIVGEYLQSTVTQDVPPLVYLSDLLVRPLSASTEYK